MKVLQLIHTPQLRGAEIFAAQLSDNLESEGHSSKLLAIYENKKANSYNRNCLCIKANPRARLWDKPAWKELAKKIEEEQPDIVQANAGDTLKYAVFSKLLYRWPQPLVFRNASTLSSYLRNPLQKAFTGFLFKQADAVASVSEFSRQDLTGLFSNLTSRSVTIPIGLESKKEVRNPFPAASANKVNLVHVGGFSFEKNHKGLLRIFEKVSEALPQADLWLVGDGPLRLEVEAQVQEMGLQERVHFAGFVNNPLDYIAHAEALLLPSIIEGLPAVILEAMLYDTPVIASKVGGIGEVVVAGETGWIIAPGDEKGFAEAVIAAVTDSRGNRKEILEKANKLICREYMNKHIAAKFVQLYEKVSTEH